MRVQARRIHRAQGDRYVAARLGRSRRVSSMYVDALEQQRGARRPSGSPRPMAISPGITSSLRHSTEILRCGSRISRNARLQERALIEADRRKDEFLATLAHELRNPLAPIRQAATIARNENATDAQKRWSSNVIERQVQHMSLLLDDLLDVSRITHGTLQLRKQPTDLQVHRQRRGGNRAPAHRRAPTPAHPRGAGRPAGELRSAPSGAGVVEPAHQRGQVHQSARNDSRPRRSRKRTS